MSVATTHQINEHHHGGQINVGISHHVWANDYYQNDTRNTQANSTYTAGTFSGSQVGITSVTLVGLMNWQTYQQGAYYWVNFGTSWINLSDGLNANPHLLPNGQISLTLNQNHHHQYHQNALNTTLTIP